MIAAGGACPYVFVHVPIRQIRGNKPKLLELGIMNRNADPAWFIYHEDGLIGTFSFQDLAAVKLTEEDIREILDTLAQQGVLMRANINNRQIQFKDLAARRRIEESGEKVYVRVENRPLEKAGFPQGRTGRMCGITSLRRWRRSPHVTTARCRHSLRAR